MSGAAPSPLRTALRRTRHRLARARTDAIARWIAARPGHEVTLVLGLRRSGNHALVDWILARTPGPAAFYNNIRAGAPPASAAMAESRLRAGGPGRLVYSYEDMQADEMLSGALPDMLAAHAARGGRIRLALILRDPHNLFASRIRKWPDRFAGSAGIATQAALYRGHLALARAGVAGEGGLPVTTVLYDRFVRSGEVRADLAGRLELRPGPGRLERVPVYGHGSSFDGTGLAGTALGDRVLGRWRAMSGDPRLAEVLAQDGLMAEAEAVFGPLPLAVEGPGCAGDGP